jgi:bifunctional enzyme CysN/CysC
MSVKSTNLVAVTHRVSQEERWKAHGHRGGVLWFTGLPGSGKSTLALELEQRLFKSGRQVYVLDGDNVRHGLSSDLGFSPEDRTENIRRIGEVAALFANAGMIVLTAFISPYRADRDLARKACGDAFHEVYVNAPLEVCESRDPKGHYKMAREGKIPEFTGISAPYEPPLKPEFTVDTGAQSLDESADTMVDYIEKTFTV